MTRKTIICIGEAMVEFRRADDGHWTQGFGGDTLNVGWALRALLAEAEADVQFLSRVGQDPVSDRFVAFLAKAGISTERLGRDPERSIGLYTIETDAAGERSFSYWRGQSAARHLAARPDGLHRALDMADMVYFSGITLAILPPGDRAGLLGALRRLKGAGATVAFDPNVRPRLWEDPRTMCGTIEEAAGIADIVLPTFEDERLAFGDATPADTVARYARLGAREICVKNGVAPTCYGLETEQGAVEVPDAVVAVDTTGAGDGFNGAYLACRLQGAAVRAAIRAGQAVSRAVVRERGALIDMGRIRDARGRLSRGTPAPSG
jgi:2-dehydro-3-deoxygluconokinase